MRSLPTPDGPLGSEKRPNARERWKTRRRSTRQQPRIVVIFAIIAAAPLIEKFQKGSHPEDRHGCSFREIIERCRGSLARLLISSIVADIAERVDASL